MILHNIRICATQLKLQKELRTVNWIELTTHLHMKTEVLHISYIMCTCGLPGIYNTFTSQVKAINSSIHGYISHIPLPTG